MVWAEPVAAGVVAEAVRIIFKPVAEKIISLAPLRPGRHISKKYFAETFFNRLELTVGLCKTGLPKSLG